MTLEVVGQNAAADGIVAAGYTWLALFDGDPGGAGAELSGGSPAYARKSVTFAAASGGSRAASNVPITFDIPAGSDVSHWALYTASTAGTRGLYGAFAGTESYTGQGTFDVNTVVIDPLAT